MFTAELAFKAQAGTGEGTLWDDRLNRLLWIDIPTGEIHSIDTATGVDRLVFKSEQYIGTVVQREDGGLVAALQHGFYFIDEETGAMTPICDPEQDKPHTRFNDGKCDPAGRFWAGTMNIKSHNQPDGSLYCLDTDLSCRKMASDLKVSNGIIWSADAKTMYYTDTLAGVIWAYDYDMDTGSISSRRTVIEIAAGEGGPDGFTIDAEGMLWVAQWGGWQVGRYDPATGKKIGKVEVPAKHVSSCAFGGVRLDELYITTATGGISPEDLEKQPLAGSLFVAKTGTIGVKASRFKG